MLLLCQILGCINETVGKSLQNAVGSYLHFNILRLPIWLYIPLNKKCKYLTLTNSELARKLGLFCAVNIHF